MPKDMICLLRFFLTKVRLGQMKALIAVIIILVLILVIIGIIYYAYIRIMRKIQSFSRLAFGTSSLTQGVRKMELTEMTTPKSIAAATGLYLPSIMRDFPEFHYEEMRTRAENVLKSYLRSVDQSDSSILTEGTNELREELGLRIQALRNEGKSEHFEQITIHRTEINRYRKEKGRCSIVFQSAVGHVHYIEAQGKVTAQEQRRLSQTRYNTELVYIQDQNVIENTSDEGLAMNCPNCGAPLTKLGAKICPYCDSPVAEFNIRVWNFSRVTEVK